MLVMHSPSELFNRELLATQAANGLMLFRVRVQMRVHFVPIRAHQLRENVRRRRDRQVVRKEEPHKTRGVQDEGSRSANSFRDACMTALTNLDEDIGFRVHRPERGKRRNRPCVSVVTVTGQ
jgi:hypothetical protein